MVTKKQVIDGLALYAENEMLTTLSGWELWAASAAMVLLYQRAELLLALALENKAVKLLGLVDDNGLIDIETAIETAKSNVKKSGKLEIDLPFWGKSKFDESDFEKLKQYITASQA